MVCDGLSVGSLILLVAVVLMLDCTSVPKRELLKAYYHRLPGKMAVLMRSRQDYSGLLHISIRILLFFWDSAV